MIFKLPEKDNLIEHASELACRTDVALHDAVDSISPVRDDHASCPRRGESCSCAVEPCPVAAPSVVDIEAHVSLGGAGVEGSYAPGDDSSSRAGRRGAARNRRTCRCGRAAEVPLVIKARFCNRCKILLKENW